MNPKINSWSIALLVVSLIGASCAVKEYPREVNSKEKCQTNTAYIVDTAMARTQSGGYRLFYGMDKQVARIDYSYYLDPKFREDPRLFYPAPDGPPEIESREKIGEEQGVEVFLLKWKSKYAPRNPAFRKYYDLTPETHDVYAVYLKSKIKNKGALIVSHGWMNKSVTEEYQNQKLIEHTKDGFDVLLLQQPYHGLRQPADSTFSGEYFFSAEVSRINEAFCQSVTDTRTAYLWLRNNYEVVGAKGGSLGGITTLLLAANQPGLDFAVALVPPSNLGTLPADGALAHFVLKGMEDSGIDQELAAKILFVSDPTSFEPAIPKDDILIIAGMGDNFVPVKQPLAVWEAWDHPPIFWYAGGHTLNYQLAECVAIEAAFLRAGLE